MSTNMQTVIVAVDKIYCGNTNWSNRGHTSARQEYDTLHVRVSLEADSHAYCIERQRIYLHTQGYLLWRYFTFLQAALHYTDGQKTPMEHSLNVLVNGHDADYWVKKIENFKDDTALERSIKQQQKKGLI